MFQVERIGHVGLNVSDVERSILFYQEVLGLKVTGRWGKGEGGAPGNGIVFMRCEEWHHDLVLFPLPDGTAVPDGNSRQRRQVGLNHIALVVPDRTEFFWALEHVRSKGVTILDGPKVHGPEGDGFVGASGSRAFYFPDPDGNIIEIYCDMLRVDGRRGMGVKE